MISLDTMNLDIAYHMACEYGFSPEECLANEFVALRREVEMQAAEREVQLVENAQRVIRPLVNLLEEMRSYNPNDHQRTQCNNLAQAVKEYAVHNLRFSNNLKAIKDHLQEEIRQRDVLRQTLFGLRVKQKKEHILSPAFSFLQEACKRATAHFSRTGRY